MKTKIFESKIKSSVLNEVKNVTVGIEVANDIDNWNFGQYYIFAIVDGVKNPQPTCINDYGNIKVKELCKNIEDAISFDEIEFECAKHIFAQTVNLYYWKSVITDVRPILNATLQYEEIACHMCSAVGDDQYKLDNETILSYLEFRASSTSEIYNYKDKDDLIRFVTQIFIVDWLQGINGIRMALGRKNSINTIETAYDTILNNDIEDALKYGSEIRNQFGDGDGWKS